MDQPVAVELVPPDSGFGRTQCSDFAGHIVETVDSSFVAGSYQHDSALNVVALLLRTTTVLTRECITSEIAARIAMSDGAVIICMRWLWIWKWLLCGVLIYRLTWELVLPVLRKIRVVVAILVRRLPLDGTLRSGI